VLADAFERGEAAVEGVDLACVVLECVVVGGLWVIGFGLVGAGWGFRQEGGRMDGWV
jgi:hypothetical protein